MAKKQLMEIPTKHISRKKQKNGAVYIYYRTRYFRDENGKPRFNERSIGKVDAETGKLIPNKNYWEIFGRKERIKYELDSIKSVGIDWVFNKIAEKLKLKEILSLVYPKETDDLLALAYYMIAEGNVMTYMEDWLETQVVSLDISRLNSQRISELFQSLTTEREMEFFRKWTTSHGNQDYWVYDVTSISSYSESNEQLEYGYNRDKEYLPQLNLGMCYGQSSRLPLFYQVYSGSIPDKSFFPYVLQSFPFTSDGQIRFVLDQGFLTKKNLEELAKEEEPYRIVSSLPHHWKDMKRLIDTQGQDIKQDEYYLIPLRVHTKKIEDTVLGIQLTIHLFYDMAKELKAMNELYAHLDKLEQEMKVLQKSALNKTRYTNYFDFEKPEEQIIHYKRKRDAINQTLARSGYFALITTDSTLSSEEVLKVYRQKDQIEKAFHQVKNDLECRRLNTHSQGTTNGKIFVAFIALIIRTYLLNQLATLEDKYKISVKKLLMELNKIQQVTTKDGEIIYMPLTGRQKRILNLFEVDYEKIIG